jgi:hypothetical protein
MGNIFGYNKKNDILYQMEIDKNIFLCVKSKNDNIIEMIKILENNKTHEGKLIHCNEISPNILSYGFENGISLVVYKSNPSFYKLTYNGITIQNNLYNIEPINFLSENIDKIYYMIYKNYTNDL